MKQKLINKLGFTIAFLAVHQCAESAVLLDENFTSSDGGFLEAAVTGSPTAPWLYSADTGSWSVVGTDSGWADSLVGPELVLGPASVVHVVFEHRYKFENTYDSGALQYSVNGGDWKNIPPNYFVENGYTGLIADGTILSNQRAFTGTSPGYDEGLYISSTVDLPPLPAGARVKVRFVGAWDVGTLASGGGPAWEVSSVRIETLLDTDGDGMPDVFEQAHGLDKLVNDATADLDKDGSANLQEYLLRTAPDNPDTDGDGYLDGVETGTKNWLSAASTGTDPLMADTDGDGLLDGLENPDQVSLGLTQAGSNPNKADTDADGWADYTEAAFHSDPKVPTSKPSLNALPLHLLAWWNFNDASRPTTALDVSHSMIGQLLGGAAYTDTGGGRTGTAGDRALDMGIDQVAGRTMSVPDASFLNLASGKNQISVSFWQKLNAVTQSFTFFSNAQIISAHSTWNDDRFYWDCSQARLSVAKPAATDLTTGWHHVVLQKNGGQTEVWLDGALLGTKTGVAAFPSTFSYLFIGSGDAGTNYNMEGLLDDFAVYSEALSPAQIARLAAGDTPASILPVALDSDGDGMLDVYEDANGLNKNDPADRDTDLDNDGATNYQESVLGSKANNPDTDGDGLKDGVENASGKFLSAASTGTSPLEADTDKDGFTDKQEDGTGIFVSTTQTGTNPNKPDSDGDGLDDFYEITVLHTNASDPTSPPLGAGTGIGVAFTYGGAALLAPADVAGFAFVSQDNWNNTNGAASADTSAITGPLAGKLVDGTGAATAATITWSGSNAYGNNNGSATPNSKLMNNFLGTFSAVNIELQDLPYSTYDIYAYVGGDVNGRTGDISLTDSGERYFYSVNTAKGGFQYKDFAPVTATTPATRAPGNYVVFRNQGGTNVQLHLNVDGGAGSGIHALQIVPIPDTDGDGISDSYEDANGLNKNSAADKDTDLDGDGLSNLVEYKRHTRANKTDTDDDGLSDAVETNSGEWKNAFDTGTSPLNPDMDGDGLKDGVETNTGRFVSAANTGSDPFVVDTDLDGMDDGVEVAAGRNPVDPNDAPEGLGAGLTAYWNFDGNLNDIANTNILGDSTVADTGSFTGAPDVGYTTGSGRFGGKALALNGGNGWVTVPKSADTVGNAATRSVSVSVWLKANSFDSNWQAAIAQGEGSYWRLARFSNSSPAAMNFAGAGDASSLTLFTPPTAWYHVAAVVDNGTTTLYINGQPEGTSSGTLNTDLASAANLFIGANPQVGGREWNGQIDDVGIWNRALSADEVAEIYSAGDGSHSLGVLLGMEPPLAFGITASSYDPVSKKFSLTWQSRAGGNYSVNYSTDLQNWAGVVTDNIPAAAGSTTTHTFTVPAALSGASRLFFRVMSK